MLRPGCCSTIEQLLCAKHSTGFSASIRHRFAPTKIHRLDKLEPVMTTKLKNTVHLSESAKVDSGSVQPFTRSQKIYVQGSRPDILVPMREISPVSYTHLTLPTKRIV